ncbi:hypothetical protein ACPCSP_34000 [Streptomyces cinereoruber]|uniref:hypothetical protein n=1 Tax=Streptomyces cinereoruber TaxID=67260 RepID=UPI003C30E421
MSASPGDVLRDGRKKGKIPVDKPAVRQIVKDFSADITTSNPANLAYEHIQDKLSAASH